MNWPTTSPASRGYGTAWRKLREIVLLRDCYLCQQCKREGRVTVGNIVDHIKPKAKGGTDEPTNLQTLCQQHHDDKSLRDVGKSARPTIGLDGWPIE